MFLFTSAQSSPKHHEQQQCHSSGASSGSQQRCCSVHEALSHSVIIQWQLLQTITRLQHTLIWLSFADRCEHLARHPLLQLMLRQRAEQCNCACGSLLFALRSYRLAYIIQPGYTVLFLCDADALASRQFTAPYTMLCGSSTSMRANGCIASQP